MHFRGPDEYTILLTNVPDIAQTHTLMHRATTRLLDTERRRDRDTQTDTEYHREREAYSNRLIFGSPLQYQYTSYRTVLSVA
jgi:hypothetical protein